MKSLYQYITERNIGNVRRNIKFDINIGTTNHADERLTRHGTSQVERIEEEEIYDLIRRASEHIIDGLVYNMIDINSRNYGRFCIQDSYTKLNVVGSVTGDIDADTMQVNIITVYRGEDFRNDPQKTYTIIL